MSKKDSNVQINSAKPDFENNLSEFEIEFLRFTGETDPNFDVSLLRHNPNAPITIIERDQSTEQMHPTTKYELKLPIRLATPQTVNTDIIGDKVILESNIKVKGNVLGINEVFIGPNCQIEGNVVGSQKVRIEEGSKISGTVTGEIVELSGPLEVAGPVVSRSDLTVTGSLQAQSLVAGGNIFLLGTEGDQVNLSAPYIIARTGDIEATVPLFLGTNRATNVDTQKFYFSQGNGSFRLVRARHAKHEQESGNEQYTILTALTDTELEKLLTELAVLEQHG